MRSKFYTRPLFVLGLVGLLPIAAMAQGPHIGLKAGLNLSNLHSAEVNDDNGRLGFNGGLFGRTMPDDAFGLQVELLYSTKGNETTYHAFFNLIDQKVDFKLDYLELPIMASFRFADHAAEIQAGFYAAYLLNAKVTTSGDLGSGSNELDKGNFRSLDAGLALGLAFNAGPAQLGIRYEYGLSQIADSDNAVFLLGDAKNSCAQFYIAVGMPH